MHDLGQAEVPPFHISKRAQQEMSMIGYDNDGMQVKLPAVFLKAFDDNLSCRRRKFAALVSGESDEDWPMVLLNVGKTAAIIILRLHEIAAPWAV